MKSQYKTEESAATHLLHQHHDGSDKDEWDRSEGTCCFCLHEGSGAPVEEVVSQKYFNDYPLMEADTGHVCKACAYCINTRTLKQGQWIAHSEDVLLPSTGDLLEVFRKLRAGEFETPLAVHVTSSPILSSHAYLWTPINQTDTPLTVAYDRQTVRISDWDSFSTLVGAIEDLRLHGFTFDEIRSGEPRVRNLREIGREHYQERNDVIDPHRRTARLELALTLSRGGDDQPRTSLSTTYDPLEYDD